MKHTLSNGMTVLGLQSRHAPVIALQAWIRFGAADESEDIAGLAHLFEHLLFKGTEKRPVGKIAQEVEAMGGDLNAYTSYDHTVMHMTLGSQHLEHGMDILSDSLKNSVVDDGELSREKPVILEEIKRRNDMPASIASDIFRKELFQSHPYARPVIGYASVVANMARETLMKQYHRYYNTKNVFLLVTGDFEDAALIDLAEKYFSNLRSGTPPAQRPVGEKTKRMHAQFANHKTPHALVHMGWQAPQGFHPDAAALDALALIMGQGESSRLVRTLVHEQDLVRAIGSSFWGPKDAGSFSIAFKGSQGCAKNFGRITQGIYDCFAQPILEAELQKAKKNLLATDTYSKETVDGLADRYGYFESIANDWEHDHRYLEQVRNLSTTDIERVKHQYINWESTVAGGIFPEKEKVPTFTMPTAKIVKTKKAPVSETAVEKFTFNGLTVLLKPVRHLPMFCLRWVGVGGKRIEPANKGGLGSLWARTVANGGIGPDGKRWEREELNEFVDRASASFSAFHGRNSFGYQLDGLSEDFEALFPILVANKCQPLFDKDVFAQEKTHQLADLKSVYDSPGSVAGFLLNENMFPKHAYGRIDLGTKASITRLSVKDIRAYHQKLEREPQVLSVVGNIRRDQLESMLSKYFAKQKFTTKSPDAKVRAVSYPKKVISLSHHLQKEQSHVLLGFPTVNMYHKDRWALLGLSAVLSGQGGRLFMELRDKMSLCYTVAPTQMAGIDGGYFGFYIATSPDKVQTSVEALRREIGRVIENGIGDTEWQTALEFYCGNNRIEQQRLSSQATGMVLDELYGLGYQNHFEFEKNLSRVTAKDLQTVAKKYLDANSKRPQVLVVVGPK